MSWNTEFALSILPQMLRGLWLTVQATAGGSLLALVLGLVLALAARSGNPGLTWPARAITEMLRRTPLLVHLYLLFYALPELGLRLSPLAAGILGLGLHTGAYMSIVYQTGIDAVPPGQWEAARALNYTRTQMWLRIILPQAVRLMIPALGNYVLMMFKESALLAVLTVPETMQTATSIGSKTYRYLEAFTVAGAVYLVISLPVAALLRRLEIRLAAGRA